MRLPSDDASALDWLLFQQSGVITVRQGASLLSQGRVRSPVATGRWQRPCSGVLVTHSGRLDPSQQVWVAVLAAGASAVLAGLAAAREGGLRRVRTRRGNAIDVYVPAVFVHRTRGLPERDLQRGRPVRTTAAGGGGPDAETCVAGHWSARLCGIWPPAPENTEQIGGGSAGGSSTSAMTLALVLTGSFRRPHSGGCGQQLSLCSLAEGGVGPRRGGVDTTPD